MTVTSPSSLDASRLKLEWTKHPKPTPEPDSPEVLSMKTATDHMITVSWTSARGWDDPKLTPYGPIPVMPSAKAFHYATEAFEGMKVYRGDDGKLRLLRPIYNCNRMLASAARISLPSFEPEELRKLIRKLCEIEAPKCLPKNQGGSNLYIRPSIIGTDDSLGTSAPEEALLYIFIIHWPTPKTNAPALRLLSSPETAARAWPGGTGAAKIGANYSPTIQMLTEAKSLGYDQVLWLFGPDREITEAGAANFFVIWRTAEGALQMVTPPLGGDQTILAGGTRRSILELSRKMFSADRSDEIANEAESCEVVERKITMTEVAQAAEDNRVQAAFVTGTAYWLQPVSEILFDGRTVAFPVGQVPHMALLREKLNNIVYGREPSPWVEVIDEN
ncbi:branched-chain amino acid cytosolic [Colletotrichum plurivorum]|uniref:Branched-chain amino acid cytosolic n=1 Tax=Colletotrichum plurivorum TaxID=2175906 RepID=A0A8H6K632_9PEZI|nr:branched-chain amino acid cytosolic [Colletotrichum plurivorum]